MEWSLGRVAMATVVAPGTAEQTEAMAMVATATVRNLIFLLLIFAGDGFAQQPLFLNEKERACATIVKDQLLPCANLFKSRWASKKLERVDLRWANLRESQMRRLTCTNADFREADLRGVKAEYSRWGNCMLEGVQLQGAKLSGARFNQTNLTGASLQRSFLYSAQFKEANLRGADLTDAVVIGANFQTAVFDEKTRLPFSKEEAMKRGMIFVP